MASTKPAAGSRPRGVRRIVSLIVVAILLIAGAGASFLYLQREANVNTAWLD